LKRDFIIFCDIFQLCLDGFFGHINNLFLLKFFPLKDTLSQFNDKFIINIYQDEDAKGEGKGYKNTAIQPLILVS